LDIKELKWVFRYEITNPTTIDVLREACQGVEVEKLKWPGKKFSMHEEEGKAMLGAPNGVGVAWLLATHKEQFGDLMVESVRVWITLNLAGRERYHAVYKIEPLSWHNSGHFR
jgi:hypothetical protein